MGIMRVAKLQYVRCRCPPGVYESGEIIGKEDPHPRSCRFPMPNIPTVAAPRPYATILAGVCMLSSVSSTANDGVTIFTLGRTALRTNSANLILPLSYPHFLPSYLIARVSSLHQAALSISANPMANLVALRRAKLLYEHSEEVWVSCVRTEGLLGHICYVCFLPFEM